MINTHCAILNIIRSFYYFAHFIPFVLLQSQKTHKAGLGNMSDNRSKINSASLSDDFAKAEESPKPKNLMDYKPKNSLNPAVLSFTGGDKDLFTEKRERSKEEIIMDPRVIFDTGEGTALKLKDIDFNSGKYEESGNSAGSW